MIFISFNTPFWNENALIHNINDTFCSAINFSEIKCTIKYDQFSKHHVVMKTKNIDSTNCLVPFGKPGIFLSVVPLKLTKVKYLLINNVRMTLIEKDFLKGVLGDLHQRNFVTDTKILRLEDGFCLIPTYVSKIRNT
ncbi:hypothetical protein RF11_10500 [Thelohanellus kitauei]|uniref:Uncharacterized protein n=1 Tax=Thelohanellus kitauei TaxID=669202 RepID=A0A0C2IZU2_THEKT|nr:hypothetical protein RF11_10500 [Thelohanellus kitauei]